MTADGRNRPAPIPRVGCGSPDPRGTLFHVPSSEPDLTGSPSTGSARELTGGDVDPLKSNVALSTHVLVVGVMLLFFLSATLITLQASWQWWLSAVAVAVPVTAVLIERFGRVRTARKDRRLEIESALRAAAGGNAPSGR